MLLKEGAAAAKAGDRELARRLLLQSVEINPRNETGWLWLASVTDSLEDRMTCLQRVLEIDPNNEKAQTWFKSAQGQLTRVMLQKATASAKQGDQELARTIARNVVKYDPLFEQAWLLLAYLTDSLSERMEYLERVLEINPANQRATASLGTLRERLTPSPPIWKCAVCLREMQGETHEPPRRCAACNAILVLDDIDELFDKEPVDQRIVIEAIHRCENALPDNPEYSDLYTLGLVHLNARNFDEGVAYLHAALRLNSDNKILPLELEAIVKRQASIELVRREEQEKKKNQRTILVVDDSPTVRKLVAITLEKQGHRVITASDGMEALAKINEQIPDLIFLDVTMPRIDGYQLCKLIKKNQDTRHVPVVMLSGKDGLFDKMRGRMAGSTRYLTKPFEPQVLLQVVDEHCIRGNNGNNGNSGDHKNGNSR